MQSKSYAGANRRSVSYDVHLKRVVATRNGRVFKENSLMLHRKLRILGMLRLRPQSLRSPGASLSIAQIRFWDGAKTIPTTSAGAAVKT